MTQTQAAVLATISEQRCYNGTVGFYSHASASTGGTMRFGVFRPPGRGPFPVLTYLAGLTCSEETFLIKAGAARYAAEAGLMLVAPDTSPRGHNVPGEAESWDFGIGAGFYLDATQDPWATNWRMESYVAQELPALIAANFPADPEYQGIFGHSMGGHGALTLALRHPGQWRSVSAFAPICAPTQCPWGEKAFTGYLGPDRAAWAEPRCLRAAALPRPPALPAPGRPGPGRQVPGRAAQAGAAGGGGGGDRAAADAAAACGLRSLLLVHPDLHRGSRGASCAGAGGRVARRAVRGLITPPGTPARSPCRRAS